MSSMWYSIRIGTYLVKYSPFDDEDESYAKCDTDGTILEYVKGTTERGHYVNPKTKEVVPKPCILVNGVAREKLERTKETDRYREVDRREVENLVNAKEYMIECDKLLNDLRATGKALKFGLSFGGTSKPYYAYIYVNALYDRLEMKISKGNKQGQYEKYGQEQADRQALKEITMRIQTIDKAKVEDLITI